MKIKLKGLVFHAKHGYYEEENILGNTFEVDVVLKFSSDKKKYKLEDTVDYTSVYELIKETFKEREELLENLCNKIIGALLKEFELIQKVTIEVKKMNAPIGGTCKYASVKVSGKNKRS